MATLQKQKGKYWYLIESVRVNGKPRPKILAYLGKTEDLIEKLQGKKPISSKSYEYGSEAVVNRIIEKLDLVSTFNSVVNTDSVPRRNGLDFGQTMALIILQRAIKPSSKSSFSNWSKETFLPQMYNFDFTKVTCQHFWDMMDLLPTKKLNILESHITKKSVDTFKLQLDTLFYDYTNFFTFIDTKNSECTLAQRGKNKQKRDNLRQFSLALLVSRTINIPLFSELYPGNRNDSKEFSETISCIKDRLSYLSQDIEKLTIVFDKGSNSKDNFDKLGDLHFVGSLSLAHDNELKEIPFSEFQWVTDKENSLLCYRTKKNIWGSDKTIVMYKSQSLYEGHILGLNKNIEKVQKDLEVLRAKAAKGYFIKKRNQKQPWTEELLEKQIESIKNKQFVREIIDFKIVKKNKIFDLSFSINQLKLEHLKNTVLGKRLLITDRHDWTTEEIIKAYHDQYHVEHTFRQIKNPYHNCVRPQFHWTDQKIIVHTFCSTLSLMISGLIEKIARDNGFDFSIEEIYRRLSSIRKVKYLYPVADKDNKYDIEYGLESIEDPQTQKLFELLMKS